MHNGALRKWALALTFWLALHTASLRAQIFTAPLQASTTGTNPVDFEYRADGTMIAKGNIGVGGLNSTDEGSGTRMLWFPALGAFRAGGASATEWNAANIGQYSMAFGYGTTASGPFSAAFGAATTASGDYATSFGVNTSSQSMLCFVIGQYNVGGGTGTSWVATDPIFEIGNGTSASAHSDALVVYKNGNTTINGVDNEMPNQTLVNANSLLTEGLADSRYFPIVGSGSTATGTGAVALGQGNTATGTGSFASGYNSTANWGGFATGYYANATDGGIAMGNGVNSTGSDSVAMGEWTSASGECATALGFASSASGLISTAMGVSTASGQYSTSMGQSSTASGSDSTAMGKLSTASGSYSTAMGIYSTASGVASTASGHNSNASGYSSTASGYHATAGGNFSTALGTCTTASAYGSTAFGALSTASSLYSTAMGSCSLASGGYSTAMGNETVASGGISTAMGNQTQSPAYAELTLGQFNIGSCSTGGSYAWIATDPLLEIGNGTDSAHPSDALLLDKSGNLTVTSVTVTAPGGDIPMFTGN